MMEAKLHAKLRELAEHRVHARDTKAVSVAEYGSVFQRMWTCLLLTGRPWEEATYAQVEIEPAV